MAPISTNAIVVFLSNLYHSILLFRTSIVTHFNLMCENYFPILFNMSKTAGFISFRNIFFELVWLIEYGEKIINKLAFFSSIISCKISLSIRNDSLSILFIRFRQTLFPFLDTTDKPIFTVLFMSLLSKRYFAFIFLSSEITTRPVLYTNSKSLSFISRSKTIFFSTGLTDFLLFVTNC